MARPRGKKRAAPEPALDPGPRPTALTIKGTLEWRAWVDEGAEHCRTDVAKLVDAALVHYLKAQGFLKPPPKR
jgi:hypothetical protein